jgi:seryl-tRNA synthetase
LKSLNKQQRDERDKLADDIDAASTALAEAQERYNAAVQAAWAELRPAIEKVNEALEAAQEWRDEIVSAQDNYFSERSEKWQEGDVGSQYQSWKEQFENIDFELFEMETPDDVEAPDKSDVVDELRNLPDQPE